MLPEKRAAQSTLENRFVFYKLVNATTGEAVEGTEVDAVLIHRKAIIVEVRDAIYIRHPLRLKHIEMTDLKIYENEASFGMKNPATKDQPLSPDCPIGSFGETRRDPLITHRAATQHVPC